jgi:anti-anti-sigma factor
MAHPDRPEVIGSSHKDPPEVSVLVAGRSGGDTFVRIVGRLDENSAPRVNRELAAVGRLHRRGPPRLVLDLSGVSYVDEAGLQVLLDLQERLVAESGDLVLQSPTAAVIRLLHEAHTDGTARRPPAAGPVAGDRRRP